MQNEIPKDLDKVINELTTRQLLNLSLELNSLEYDDLLKSNIALNILMAMLSKFIILNLQKGHRLEAFERIKQNIAETLEMNGGW